VDVPVYWRVCFSVIVCLHAFGFGFEALADRRDQAMATRAVATLSETNYTDQIATLERQKDSLRADRDGDVERLQASIQGILTDGLNNDQLADVYRSDQTRITDEARRKIGAIDDQILGLMQQANAAETSATVIEADEKPWAPLYIGMAQLGDVEQRTDRLGDLPVRRGLYHFLGAAW
jgi:hypothetical protein